LRRNWFVGARQVFGAECRGLSGRSTMSFVGTNRTNRAGLMLSVNRGGPEVALLNGQDRL